MKYRILLIFISILFIACSNDSVDLSNKPKNIMVGDKIYNFEHFEDKITKITTVRGCLEAEYIDFVEKEGDIRRKADDINASKEEADKKVKEMFSNKIDDHKICTKWEEVPVENVKLIELENGEFKIDYEKIQIFTETVEG